MQDVKIRMDKNFECIKELERFISVQDSDEGQLEVLSLIGKMYAEYTTGVYSSDFLEQKLVEIGRKINFSPSGVLKDNQILVVMSACAAIGGHTVLVHNWIKWDDNNKYSIVFTDMDGVETPDFIKSVVQESGGTLIYLSGSYLEKALKLLEISEGFERVILFNHMEDIVPVLAYSNKHWNVPVYFYNHADFRFSYGFLVSDVVLNLCEFDVEKSIRYRGIMKQNSIYLQFPGFGKMEQKRYRLDRPIIRKKIGDKYELDINTKLIISMGSDFKYENIIGYEFDTYVSDVLGRYDGRANFLIIGAEPCKEKWIQLEKKTDGRAKALGVLPREEAEKLIVAADLYIVSFPMAAAGQCEAEQAGIPWLGLNIYGRGVKEGDIRYANSVEELIEKTLDILNGNGQKYLAEQNSDVWTKQEWKEKWHEICYSMTSHRLHAFRPQRHLEKQEYVNCQLMQEQATKSVCNYVCEHSLSEQLMKELFRLDRKYDMGIVYQYAVYQKRRCIDLERLCENLTGLCDRRLQFSNKHLQLYLTAIKWLETRQKEKQIDRYLYQQGYRTAAIYGMSYMGTCLVGELAESSVKVLYGIDQNAENIHSVIPIFKPEDIPGAIDVILNTTMIENKTILAGLNVYHIPIIRLKELLDMIWEKEENVNRGYLQHKQ